MKIKTIDTYQRCSLLRASQTRYSLRRSKIPLFTWCSFMKALTSDSSSADNWVASAKPGTEEQASRTLQEGVVKSRGSLGRESSFRSSLHSLWKSWLPKFKYRNCLSETQYWSNINTLCTIIMANFLATRFSSLINLKAETPGDPSPACSVLKNSANEQEDHMTKQPESCALIGRKHLPVIWPIYHLASYGEFQLAAHY